MCWGVPRCGAPCFDPPIPWLAMLAQKEEYMWRKPQRPCEKTTTGRRLGGEGGDSGSVASDGEEAAEAAELGDGGGEMRGWPGEQRMVEAQRMRSNTEQRRT